ncbi:hypothetical protein [Streptomyces sp. NPDC088554]|uniref:hypothetical protein n=1 Tax=Streptomyces sp. NPDC088554 TaxID=3365865 RepID=UPI00381D63DC
MKVRMTFTVDVDPEQWCEQFGVATHAEVRDDVRSYYLNQLQQSPRTLDVQATVVATAK